MTSITPVICSFLMVAVSGAAVVTNSTNAPVIQHNAFWDGEGGNYIIKDTASALSSVTPISVTTNTTQIILSLLAPTGQKYKVDSSAYGFNPTLEFNVCLAGTNLPYFTGPGTLTSFEFINPDGVAITDLSTLSYTSYSQEYAYWYSSVQFSGNGTFDGIQLTLDILNLGTQPLTWLSGDASSLPSFYFSYNNITDQGSVLSLVPEPSTYALFGIGALGLLLAYRRRVA